MQKKLDIRISRYSSRSVSATRRISKYLKRFKLLQNIVIDFNSGEQTESSPNSCAVIAYFLPLFIVSPCQYSGLRVGVLGYIYNVKNQFWKLQIKHGLMQSNMGCILRWYQNKMKNSIKLKSKLHYKMHNIIK